MGLRLTMGSVATASRASQTAGRTAADWPAARVPDRQDRMERRTQALTAAAGIGAGILISQRIKPMPCPYSQRWMLEVPRPKLGRDDIVRAVDPRPGERVLELGPGTGYHSFAVAERLEPDGELHAFDIQQKMLDHLVRLAAERGAENIRPRQGDARDMPYTDEQFDAAFLVTVLGEIPDEERALAE